MGKVIILNGSPRKKNGHTVRILRELEKGVKSVGGDVIWWELNDPTFLPCQGCNWCIEHDGCSIQDGMTPMFQQLRDCDAVAFGSPNYFFTVSAQLKLWLDRMAFMHEGDTPLARYPGKKFVSIYVQGLLQTETFKSNYDWIDNGVEGFGWEKVDQYIVGGTLDIPDFQYTDEQLARAFKDGEILGSYTAPPLAEAKANFAKFLEESGVWSPHMEKL